jgi:hypothetical protein
MSKLWMLALTAALPFSAAHAQIGGAPGGSGGSDTTAGSNASQSTAGGKGSSGSDKDANKKAGDVRQAGPGASGIGWSSPGGHSGSSAASSAGSSRWGMPATTTGF